MDTTVLPGSSLRTRAGAGLLPLGALVQEGGVLFRVWAPKARRVDLVIEPEGRTVPLRAAAGGYHEGFVAAIGAGTRYRYRFDGGDALPDPASRFQPEGVHGPSLVVDPAAYAWHDEAWQGLPRERLVFYELHVGTFSTHGTYAGVQERLDYLRDLGVTAIELMPLADFPGRWNWGYDPAALYAPSRAYGTPDELRALVDAAHHRGMAVFLDVIYNHVGPDGAYLAAHAPFFTDKHETPWGQAVNLDDTHSEGVRNFFLDNALHWLREYHFDGFRLDAVHALEDDSDVHFLAELSEAVAGLEGRRRYLVAEDNRNLNRLVFPRERGGYGLDAVWADDFHHQIRNVTAGDEESYYADFAGTTAADLAETLRRGWFYDGRATLRTGEPRGTDPTGVGPDQVVFAIQNHDQVGNRPVGDRLSHVIPLPLYRAVSAVLLYAPALPLVFMGQEWAASTPFQYFTDHNPELGKLVSEGRRAEFQGFAGFAGDVPDPQAAETFERSRLDWQELNEPRHATILALYRDLLALRPALGAPLEVEVHGDAALTLRRGAHHLLVALRDGETLPLPPAATLLWHTEAPDYATDGRPPEVRRNEVFFPVAGAMLLEE